LCKGDSGSASSIFGTTRSFVGAGTTFGRRPRSSANDKTIRLSLQIHKTANDSKIYDVDVREKSAGIVKATVSDHGRTGSATFEGVTLGRYGSKEGNDHSAGSFAAGTPNAIAISRSFVLTTRALGGPMRRSAFCPAESPSSRPSANP